MRARSVVSLAVAGALAVSLAGCGFVTPQATTFQYDPSDGVGTMVGQVDVEGALVLTEDGDLGNLLFTAVNPTSASVQLTVQFSGAEGKQNHTVTIAPSSTLDVGFGDAGQFPIEGLGADAGSLVKLYFQYGSTPGVQLDVPVLDGSLAQYADLLPTPIPTPTETPTPTPTATATDAPAG